MADRGGRRRDFTLHVTLDASEVKEFKPNQSVKVAVRDQQGSFQSEVVKFDKSGKAQAAFSYHTAPGPLRVLVGPEGATEDELAGMQTIAVDISGQEWAKTKDLRLAPIKVSAYYWHWWPIWCRTFTIRGRLLCPDGHPVAGATVCAFDVDCWWWWCSRDLVGCATTDITGTFEISFRWCCGWWPWWWWQTREWYLEPALLERIVPVLYREFKLREPPLLSPKPDLSVFESLVSEGRAIPRPPVPAVGAPTHPRPTIDFGALEPLRAQLKQRIPAIPELDRFQLWPWWPWEPWFDCDPDIVFRATVNCGGQETVIVDETCWQTRWDIPTTINVTLTSNSDACCIPLTVPCIEGNCVELVEACDDAVTSIGGNVGAPPTSPDTHGFLSPEVVSISGDRPYAAQIPISGTTDCMSDVDYYEFQWSDDDGVTWNDMPIGAAGAVVRGYIEFPSLTFGYPLFSAVPTPAPPPPGNMRNVFETRQHFDATNPPPSGQSRTWFYNRDVLMNWLTDATTWSDGKYRLRVRGWDLVGANLTNPRILKVCGTQLDNDIVLWLDNRLEGPGSGHPPSTPDHPCGPGTVHTCTLEPDTDFLSVVIVHQDSSTSEVSACGNVPVLGTDVLQVDFMANDPDGHLAYYTLDVTYGENLVTHILGIDGSLGASGVLAGATVTPFAGPPAPPVPAAVQVGPTYAHARSGAPPPNGGAVAPIWTGGALRLQVPASLVFPETCCYQLELRAHKRTIVSCDDSFWGHTNYSEYSFTVVV